jgi:hypothetical protein
LRFLDLPEAFMTRFASLILASMLALAGGAMPTLAADPVAVRAYDPGVCGDGKVLGRINQRFRHQVRNVPHLPQVDIADVYSIRETRHLPRHANNPIERLYCQATVALSNGQSHNMWYLIEWPLGFAGIGANVEFCVAGFDRWHVYGGRCRSLH